MPNPLERELEAILEANVERIAIDSYNTDIGSTAEGVWVSGGAFSWADQHGGEALELYSSSTSDAPGQGGAEAVVVRTLRDDRVQVEEEYELNGTTAVPLRRTDLVDANYLAVSRGVAAVGTIELRTTADSTVLLQIEAGEEAFDAARCTIPSGAWGVCRQWAAGVVGTVAARFAFNHDWRDRLGKHVGVPVAVDRIMGASTGWVTNVFEPVELLAPGTRVAFTCRALGASAASGGVKADIVLVRGMDELFEKIGAARRGSQI